MFTKAPLQKTIGAREFAQTFGANVAIQLCTIAQGILLARVLGPTGRGQFAAATLWPMVFAGIGGLGLSVALARRSARVEDLANITRTAFVLSLLTGTIATLCCGLALPWLMQSLDSTSRAAAWYFLPFILMNHVVLAFVAIDQGAACFKSFNLTRLIVNPVYLALLVASWWVGRTDVWWLVMCLLAANGAVAIARIVLAGWHYSLIGPLESPVAVVKDALPFGMANFLSPLLQYADKALLLYLLGERALGFYSVAFSAASVANSLATSAGAISFGIAAQAGDGVFTRVARVFRLTAWIWLIAGIGLACAIPFLMPLLYGNEFGPAIWPAILLIPAAGFAGLASVLEESMRAQGRAFIGLEARLSGMIVFLLAGWCLARVAGLVGVTIAFNASQFVTLIFMLCAARWHFAKPIAGNLIPRAADLQELIIRLRARVPTIFAR